MLSLAVLLAASLAALLGLSPVAVATGMVAAAPAAGGPASSSTAASPAVAAAASPPAPGPRDPASDTDRGAAARLASARQAIRSFGAALLCDSCQGRGTVMRRCLVGHRITGLGVRQPLFAHREGECPTCDGEGCRDAERIARLARVVAERLDAVPESQQRRTEALVDLRRAIAESLACAPKALALRSRELAADALLRSRDGPAPVLLVAQTFATPTRSAAAASRSPADSADDLLLEAAGTLWRIRGDGVPAAGARGWIAVLGWIEPTGAPPPTSVRAGQHVRVAEVRAIVCAVFEPPAPPPPPPKKPRA